MEILFQSVEDLSNFEQFNIIDVHVTLAKQLLYFYSLDMLMIAQSKNVTHP